MTSDHPIDLTVTSRSLERPSGIYAPTMLPPAPRNRFTGVARVVLLAIISVTVGASVGTILASLY
jgi:hypothetical protein